MAYALTWDETGKRLYETGVKNCVLYLKGESGKYDNGVAWSGITAVTENPSGAEATPLYADDMKYLNLMSNEEFGGTIEAYTFPEKFAECDGSASIAKGVTIGQQGRKLFGLAYRTSIGNDEEGSDYGYKLHLVYNCLASPSEKAYETINESPEAITFSWEFSTTPMTVNVEGKDFKPTAHIEIDSTKVNETKLTTLLGKLYGKAPTSVSSEDGVAPELPTPEEIATIFAED